MTRLLVFASIVFSIGLLCFSYVGFEEVKWRSWGHDSENNFFLILIISSPLFSLSLCYLALKENLLEYVQVSLQRRKLESLRAVLEEKQKIVDLVDPKVVQERKTNSSDFIRLWTAAGSSSLYDKSTWLAVEKQLLEVGAI